MSVRNNPAWIFIGGLFVVAGLSMLFGVAEPNAIQQRLNSVPGVLNGWGLGLALGGSGLVYATLRSDVILERLTLRILSLSLVVYGLWALMAVGFKRAAVTAALCAMLVFVFEIRIAVIELIFKPTGGKDAKP